MKLIVISHPDQFEHEARLINRLFTEGMLHFHLRKPDWSESEIRNLLHEINPAHRSKIVIHDNFEIGVEFNLGGIHFTDRTKAKMNEWLSFQGSKSLSCHSLEELKDLPTAIDYAFLSPIFPSISKAGYSADFDTEEVATSLASIKTRKVIALGGISPANVQSCNQTGFEGVAVLGFIWQGGLSENQLITQFLKLKEVCPKNALL